MKLDVENWGYLPNELNELRFAAIQTLDAGCVNTSRFCLDCSKHTTCSCMYIHDSLSKNGIKPDTFRKLKDWSATYYTYNPRS